MLEAALPGHRTEGIHRDGDTGEHEQPEDGAGPSGLQQEIDNIRNRIAVAVHVISSLLAAMRSRHRHANVVGYAAGVKFLSLMVLMPLALRRSPLAPPLFSRTKPANTAT